MIKVLALPATALLTLFLLVGSTQADYFVDNRVDCNNSHTYNPANRSCSGGTDTVFTNWNTADDSPLLPAGTSSSPTVVNVRSGTSYLYNISLGKPWVYWRKYPSDAARPVIDGEGVRPGGYDGNMLIQLDADGITLDGFEIKNVGPYSNNAEGYYHGYMGIATNWAGVARNYLTIRNCSIHDLSNSAVAIYYATNFLVEDNEFYNTQKTYEINHCYCWSGAFVTAYTNGPGLVRRNRSWNNAGEGLQTLWNGNNVVFEYNYVENSKHPCYYTHSSSDVTFRYNIAYGEYGGAHWAGIIVGNEGSGNDGCVGYHANDKTENIKVYGNMIANVRSGISITEIHTNCSAPRNLEIYNNTIINSTEAGIYIQPEQARPDQYIRNNIVWPASGVAQSGLSGTTNSNNLWGGFNLGDYFINKTSNWNSVPLGTLTGREFALGPNASSAIDDGYAVGYPYNQLLDLASVNFATKAFTLVQNTQPYDLGAGPFNGPHGPVCGNGDKEYGEQCDNGADNGACPKTCSANCTDNSCHNGTPIPKTGWICTADSQETVGMNGICQNAFDDDINTAWHTSWTGTSPLQPHNIDINLGASFNINGLRYIPRQIANTNGIVTQYEIYISQNSTEWTLIYSGKWTYLGIEAKDVTFAPVNTRFVRFKSTDDNSHHWTSMAELTLFSEAGITTPNAPGGLTIK